MWENAWTHLQPGGDHLDEEDDVEADDVDLQVLVLVVLVHSVARQQVKHAVQGVRRTLILLELLNLGWKVV